MAISSQSLHFNHVSTYGLLLTARSCFAVVVPAPYKHRISLIGLRSHYEVSVPADLSPFVCIVSEWTASFPRVHPVAATELRSETFIHDNELDNTICNALKITART